MYGPIFFVNGLEEKRKLWGYQRIKNIKRTLFRLPAGTFELETAKPQERRRRKKKHI
jgi:hypothetical protein